MLEKVEDNRNLKMLPEQNIRGGFQEKHGVVLKRGYGDVEFDIDIDWKRSSSVMRDSVSNRFQGHRGEKEDFKPVVVKARCSESEMSIKACSRLVKSHKVCVVVKLGEG